MFPNSVRLQCTLNFAGGRPWRIRVYVRYDRAMKQDMRPAFISLFLEDLTFLDSQSPQRAADERSKPAGTEPAERAKTYFSFAIGRNNMGKCLRNSTENKRPCMFGYQNGPVHLLTTCDECQSYPILGSRYKVRCVFSLSLSLSLSSIGSATRTCVYTYFSDAYNHVVICAQGIKCSDYDLCGECYRERVKLGYAEEDDFIEVVNPTSHVVGTDHWFCRESSTWGFPCYMPIHDLDEFLNPDGSLLIQAHVHVAPERLNNELQIIEIQPTPLIDLQEQ